MYGSEKVKIGWAILLNEDRESENHHVLHVFFPNLFLHKTDKEL